MDIGERIKFCRKHRGMTQDRLAEETGDSSCFDL